MNDNRADPSGSARSACALRVLIDFHSVLWDGDSRLSRRFGAWLRVGSCFAALCQGGPWSYLRSAGCHRQSGDHRDVDRRVHVPVQLCPARPAPPGPDMQRLGTILDPAPRAHLARGHEPADPAELPPVAPGLVLHHPRKRRPPGVVHGLGQPGPGPAPDTQGLDGDRLILANQCRRP
jgi:hypothetical protein